MRMREWIIRRWIFLRFLLTLIPLIPSHSMAESFSLFNPATPFICPDTDPQCSGLFLTHQQDGSQMGLIMSGEMSLAVRLETLRNARKSILIQSLIFAGDESGLRIAEVLKQKKAQGVDVRIIIDALSNSPPQTQQLYFDLSEHDIPVLGYEPGMFTLATEFEHPSEREENPHESCRIDKRLHEKMWIVDGNTDEAVAVTGGLNIANEYFRLGSQPKVRWRDQDCILKGSIVSDLYTSFMRNFEYLMKIKEKRPDLFRIEYVQSRASRIFACLFARCGAQDENGHLILRYSKNKTTMALIDEIEKTSKKPTFSDRGKLRFFQSRPRAGESYIHQVYRKMIQEAKEEILIANAYFLPDQALLHDLSNAAKRGVQIKLLTNSKKSTDMEIMTLGTRYTYLPLMVFDRFANRTAMSARDHFKKDEPLGSIKIYEWVGPKIGEGTLHAKFAVFDRRAGIIGSYNLDLRSKNLNSETALVFEDDQQANQLAEYFIQEDLPKSQEITLDQAIKYHQPKDPFTEFGLALSEIFAQEL
jgi:cardiolipin synthase C